MRVLAGAVLILSLAACSKQEPPPAVAAAPVKEVGGSLSPDTVASSGHSFVAKAMEDKKAPPTPEPTAAAAAASPNLLQQGADLFTKTCATCHMADGYGVPNLQPQIVGSGWISAADPQPLLSLILRGSTILGAAAQKAKHPSANQKKVLRAQKGK